MKRNLKSRIATALVFASVAFLVSGCGKGNDANNGLYGGIPGAAGLVGAPGSCTIMFSGLAGMDQLGGLYAGQNFGPLSVSSVPAMVQPTQGQYQYGRIGTDGTILAFNLAQSYGGQMSIQGVLSLSPTQLAVMSGGAGMGYSYPYTGLPGATAGCGATSLVLNNLAAQPMTQAASVIGNQPFMYALFGGQVVLNGSYSVYPY